MFGFFIKQISFAKQLTPTLAEVLTIKNLFLIFTIIRIHDIESPFDTATPLVHACVLRVTALQYSTKGHSTVFVTIPT